MQKPQGRQGLPTKSSDIRTGPIRKTPHAASLSGGPRHQEPSRWPWPLEENGTCRHQHKGSHLARFFCWALLVPGQSQPGPLAVRGLYAGWVGSRKEQSSSPYGEPNPWPKGHQVALKLLPWKARSGLTMLGILFQDSIVRFPLTKKDSAEILV